MCVYAGVWSQGWTIHNQTWSKQNRLYLKLKSCMSAWTIPDIKTWVRVFDIPDRKDLSWSVWPTLHALLIILLQLPGCTAMHNDDKGFVYLLLFLCVFRGVLHCSLREIWVRHSSRKSSATWCVRYFRVSKEWYDCQCLGFLTCTQTWCWCIHLHTGAAFYYY